MTPEERKERRDALGQFNELNRIIIPQKYDEWDMLIGEFEKDPDNFYILADGILYNDCTMPRNSTPEEILARAKILARKADESFGENQRKKVTK